MAGEPINFPSSDQPQRELSEEEQKSKYAKEFKEAIAAYEKVGATLSAMALPFAMIIPQGDSTMTITNMTPDFFQLMVLRAFLNLNAKSIVSKHTMVDNVENGTKQ